MNVFVDTGAWIALVVASDRHHEDARAKFSRFLEANELLVTSNYVIDETVTWLRYHAGYGAAVAFRTTVEEAQAAQRFHIEWVSERIDRQAWGLFVKHSDEELSLTDCTSVVIARDLGLSVWTYDHHFHSFGLTVVS